PGRDAAGEGVAPAEAGLRLGLARPAERRPARLVHRHALGGELVPAEHPVDPLAGVAVLLEAAGVVTGLVVEHQDLGAAGDGRDVAEPGRLGRDRAAVHADPQAVRPARLAGHAVVAVPALHPAVAVPEAPFPVRRVAPVLPRGGGFAGAAAEPPLAVGAVAGALAVEPAPAVIRDPLGVRAFDDLAEDARDVILVVRAVDAADVEVARPVWPPRAVDGEPVGVGAVERLGGAGGVHPGEDDQAVVVGGLRELAVEGAAYPRQSLTARPGAPRVAR